MTRCHSHVSRMFDFSTRLLAQCVAHFRSVVAGLECVVCACSRRGAKEVQRVDDLARLLIKVDGHPHFKVSSIHIELQQHAGSAVQFYISPTSIFCALVVEKCPTNSSSTLNVPREKRQSERPPPSQPGSCPKTSSASRLRVVSSISPVLVGSS